MRKILIILLVLFAGCEKADPSFSKVEVKRAFEERDEAMAKIVSAIKELQETVGRKPAQTQEGKSN